MKKISIFLICTFVLTGVLLTGCSTSTEIIDLNKVLDIMTATLEELKQESPASAADPAQETIEPLDNEFEAAEYNEIFLTRFAANLNKAKLISSSIGVGMLNTGAIEGFIDKNKNSKKETSEKKLFTVEIDSERNRLIATDTQNQYRRSSHYRPGGLFTGFLLGSMLSRQRHSGIRSSRFSNMKMSDKNYHKAATSKAKSSARSKSSSRSFRSGK